MLHRSRTYYLIPLLALGAMVAAAGPLHAQYRYETRTTTTTRNGTIQIRFNTTPRWTEVTGRGVAMIEPSMRPSYDMFRFDNRYYIYRDGRWYAADYWSGTFRELDVRQVPVEISYVPRTNWVSYPVAWRNANDDDWRDRDGDWRNRDYRDRDDYDGTIRVTFRERPRWYTVPGSRVMVVNRSQMPDYDIFRLGNMYYVYSDGQWYSSHRWDGTFMAIDDRTVPRVLYRVPRRYWRSEPPEWGYWNSRYDRDGRRY